MDIELLVVQEDCPNEAAAADPITTAVADTEVQSTVTGTIIVSQDQAQQRGLVGSPTILLNGSDPFAGPDAAVALSCRLYPPGRTARCSSAAGNCDKRSSGWSPQAECATQMSASA